jgi:hypothetical protein
MVLVSYQLVGGWRAARTRDRGPGGFDALWTLLAMAALVALIPFVIHPSAGNPRVVYSSLGGLGVVLFYDSVRWVFPRYWHRFVWRYEHVYKLIATLSGMLSALIGNVVRVGQPWSQLAPSALGLLTLAFFFVQLRREDARIR